MQLKLNPTNTAFFALAHVVAVFAIVYLCAINFSWWTMGLGLLWTVLCGVSMTAGYHRLFGHTSYKASAPVRTFYLLFGAAAVQNSVLKWVAEHRAHHAHTDRQGDPYNARRGFWWSHIGWILYEEMGPLLRPGVRDLERSWLVRCQDRYYVLLALLVGAAVPMALGSLWGDAVGALLVAGFLRLVLQWHTTFCINSVSHLVGTQPFGAAVSARDNGWLAFVTFGEAYHNYHHRFPGDYRNGVRWHHFDPTKWWVWSLGRLGQTWDLRRASRARIASARVPPRSHQSLAAGDRSSGRHEELTTVRAAIPPTPPDDSGSPGRG